MHSLFLLTFGGSGAVTVTVVLLDDADLVVMV